MGRKVYIPDKKDCEYIVKSKRNEGMFSGQAMNAENKDHRFLDWKEIDLDELCPSKSEAELEHEEKMRKLKEDRAKIDLENSRRQAKHDSLMDKRKGIQETVNTILAIFGLYKEGKKFLRDNPEIAQWLRSWKDKAVEKITGSFEAAKDVVLYTFGKGDLHYERVLEAARQSSETDAMENHDANDRDAANDTGVLTEGLAQVKEELQNMQMTEEQKTGVFLLIRYALMKNADEDNPEDIFEGMGMTLKMQKTFSDWMDQMIESRPEVFEKDTLLLLLDRLESRVNIPVGASGEVALAS